MKKLIGMVFLAIALAGCTTLGFSPSKAMTVANETYATICGPVLAVVKTGTPEQRRGVEDQRLQCIAIDDALDVGDVALATRLMAAFGEQR